MRLISLIKEFLFGIIIIDDGNLILFTNNQYKWLDLFWVLVIIIDDPHFTLVTDNYYRR